jgi:hypothetical protein
MSTAPKKIREYLPKKLSETELFQAHISAGILAQVRAQRKTDNISWRALVESCFKRYLAESGVKVKDE